MASTAPKLTDINFSEVKRGYSPVEVDNFLDQLGDAVVKLEKKYHEALRRAEAAEQRSLEAERRVVESETKAAQGLGPVSDEEINATAKKTLLLAQKTADETLRAARADVEKLKAGAEAEAAQLLSGAKAEAAEALKAVEAKAAELARSAKTSDGRSTTTDPERPDASAVAELEARRDAVENDLAALETHVDALRERLSSGIVGLQAVLDDPDKLRVGARPTTSAAKPDQPPAAPPPSRPEPRRSVQHVARADRGFLDELKAAVDDDVPLGPGDPDADAAMAAFFDAEPDDPSDRKRFRRRG